MPQSEQKSPTPVPANPAVQRCCAVWDRTHKLALTAFPDDSDGRFRASEQALMAYRLAMPPLDGYQNIRDFIACVGHAMLSEKMLGIEARKLLYVARVALSALRCEPKLPRVPSVRSKSGLQTP